MPGIPKVRISVFASRPAGILSLLVLSLLRLASSPATFAQAAQDVNDQRVQGLYTEAKAAESRDDLASAVADYESLLQIAPRLAPAYNNLGALYLRMRKYQQAADILERGLKINPKMFSA